MWLRARRLRRRLAEAPSRSGSTQSEVVVPVLARGELVAVLDVDSDAPAAFREVDQVELEALCAWLGRAIR